MLSDDPILQPLFPSAQPCFRAPQSELPCLRHSWPFRLCAHFSRATFHHCHYVDDETQRLTLVFTSPLHAAIADSPDIDGLLEGMVGFRQRGTVYGGVIVMKSKYKSCEGRAVVVAWSRACCAARLADASDSDVAG